MQGKLYVVGTPIGNLKDITYRAVEVLKAVDVIAAEDTRNTVKLLNAYDIHTPMLSYHEHNKEGRGRQIIDNYLCVGKSVAIVSDAGMPMISDPGLELIKCCIEMNIEVTTVPGATAFVSGAVLSGMVDGSFVFQGFLPTDKKERSELLEGLRNETRAVIFYEAPHRLLKTLLLLRESLGGDRKIAICRELTKLYEEIRRLSLDEAVEVYGSEAVRGELVLVLAGADGQQLKDKVRDSFLSMDLNDHMQIYLSKGYDKKEAMRLVAKDRGVSKRDIYNALIKP